LLQEQFSENYQVWKEEIFLIFFILVWKRSDFWCAEILSFGGKNAAGTSAITLPLQQP
jgi:hypothetical protein